MFDKESGCRITHKGVAKQKNGTGASPLAGDGDGNGPKRPRITPLSSKLITGQGRRG